MSNAAAPPSTRTAPISLWRVAEAFLATLYMLFGAPETVAAQHTLTARAHAALSSWLRCAEAMLRRLIAIEAGALAKPEPAHARAARQRARVAMVFAADAPETWRVSFRTYGPPASRRHAAEPAGGTPALRAKPGFRSAWPLAERYEALIRVFNAPEAYARRLARRLHAAPHRLVEALRAPPEADHRVDQFHVMGHAAEAAWRAHFSSA